MIEILQSLRLTLLNIGYAKLVSSWDFDNVISPYSYILSRPTIVVDH